MYISYHCRSQSIAGTRLAKAFTNSSRTAIQSKFKMFFMFSNQFNIDYHHLKLADVLAFIILASSNISCSTIYGHMSTIKAISLQINIDITVFCHKKVSLMLKSCSRTLPFSPNTKQIGIAIS